MEDYYSVLGINENATPEEIKKAYRQLALQWHPDKNPDNQEEATRNFKRIAEAYEILGNEDRKRSYDRAKTNPTSTSFGGYTGGFPDDLEGDIFGPGGLSPEDVFGFHFRNPEDIFREFFGGDPFQDLFAGPLTPFFGFPGTGSSGSSRRSRSRFNDDIFQGATFTTGSSGRGMSKFISTSTTTSYVNGKKLTTVKKNENGVETTLVYENDVLKSQNVRNLSSGKKDRPRLKHK